MYKVAVFASGSGSNAQKIMEYFENHPQIRVTLLLSNNPQAAVLERAKKYTIPSLVFDRTTFYQSDEIIKFLQKNEIQLIVLAGFLWLVPANLIKAFPNKIINLHPALLPKYGGKGMHGIKVHQAVKEAHETESGITIHFVNEKYDEGQIIFQVKCPLNPEDSPDDIAQKIQKLEHQYLPRIIEDLLLNP